MPNLLSFSKLSAAFAGYNRLLVKHPLKTKMVTSGLFTSFSDYICQKVIEKNAKIRIEQGYNYKRTFLMALMSIAYGTPILHYWYKAVVLIAEKLTKNKKYIPLLATAIDELGFEPPYYAGWLFVVEYLDQHDIRKAAENVKEKWWSVVYGDWKLWPWATVINFKYVPADYRVLFVNFVGIFWSIYMSWLQYNGVRTTDTDGTSIEPGDLVHSTHVVRAPPLLHNPRPPVGDFYDLTWLFYSDIVA